MKYIELKNALKSKIENVYLIFGDDRYLCYDALNKIEQALEIAIKDMNSVTLSGEQTSAKDIVDSANVYPFGDERRLVVIKNFSPAKNKEDKDFLQKYFDQPLSSTCLVFFNTEGAEQFKGLKNLTEVDCSKISPAMISAYVKNILSKNGIMSNDEAVDKLIMFSNNDMARVANELEKLISFCYDTKVLTTKDVEEFVVQDREYQIFELTEFIAKGDSKNAIKLIDSLTIKSGSGFSIIGLLYNNYRRLLYVSLNKDKTAQELATLLGVKEYAIKMAKNQTGVFTVKQLKVIVDMIADYDNKIKTGEMKENVAIKTLVFNILKSRGENER